MQRFRLFLILVLSITACGWVSAQSLERDEMDRLLDASSSRDDIIFAVRWRGGFSPYKEQAYFLSNGMIYSARHTNGGRYVYGSFALDENVSGRLERFVDRVVASGELPTMEERMGDRGVMDVYVRDGVSSRAIDPDRTSDDLWAVIVLLSWTGRNIEHAIE